MALANYTDLQASAVAWMERAGQSGIAPDWIALAEARLNREIGAVEQTATLTATIGSRTVDLSGYSILDISDLFLTEVGGREVTVQRQPNGKMPYDNVSGQPSMFAIKGNWSSIEFNRPCDLAYALRLPYFGRFNLTGSNPTNDLLTNHPDVYLAATLMWGAGYNQDWSNGAAWKAVLDEEVPKVAQDYAKRRRGMLRVDPALLAFKKLGLGSYNIMSDT